MQIKEIDGVMAKVEMSGISLECDLSLIADPKIGEYVIVHAGYAIERMDEEEAAETLESIREAILDPEQLENPTRK